MNASEAVLMTSVFEASPVTIREALACNVCVISTPVGDVPSLLGPIEGCHVVEPDADKIAQTLRGVLASGQRVAAREHMMVYANERQAQQLIDVYVRAIEQRRKGSVA